MILCKICGKNTISLTIKGITYEKCEHCGFLSKKDEFINKTKFSVTFTSKDVGAARFIWCCVKSKKEWHKYRSHDSRINLHFTVLPPME